jgi:hypothetical protein
VPAQHIRQNFSCIVEIVADAELWRSGRVLSWLGSLLFYDPGDCFLSYLVELPDALVSKDNPRGGYRENAAE